MSKGIVIFAHNNIEMDYIQMSLISGMLAKYYLKQPIALITDESTLNWGQKKYQKEIKKIFDNVVVTSGKMVQNRKVMDGPWTEKQMTWNNFTRLESLKLSPFNETIVIDSDYLIFDKSLSACWGAESSIMCNHSAKRITGDDIPYTEKFLSLKSVKMNWATVLYFRKDEFANELFSLMNEIRENYKYMSLINQFSPNLYRNDYALSLAVHIMKNVKGYDVISTLPQSSILTAWTYDELYRINDMGDLVFMCTNENNFGDHTLVNVVQNSIHIFNKFSILRHYNKFMDLYYDKI